MQRISTSATLLLKFFIPTFWISFFGAITLAVLFAKNELQGGASINLVRAIVLAVFLLGCLLWWRTVAQLKRMEADEEFLYITNYFKTFRYSFNSVASLKVKDYKFFKTLSVELKEPGSFGKNMTSVISEKLFNDFIFDHPKIAFQFGFKPADD